MPSRLSRLLLIAPILLAAVAAGCEDDHGPSPLPCTYTLSTTTGSFGSDGGAGNLNVTTQATCSWTAAATSPWISITSAASTTGSGPVNYSVAPNLTTGPRTGTMLIAGQVFTISQEGRAACTYDVSPRQFTMPESGGDGTIQIATAAYCSWTAVANQPWLTIVSGAQGQGNGEVTFTVAPNAATSSRSATISAAGVAVTLDQAGAEPPPPTDCQYSVTPVEFTPCMTSPEMTSTITTQDGCTWTASTDASWVTITAGQSGIGTGVVRFRVADNWDPPRQGIVMVRWPTPTLGQNVRVLQAGCYYAVSKSTFDIAAAGATTSFDVIQQSDPLTCGGATQDRCVWTAVADVPWITIDTPMPQAGDNRVTFTVAPNSSPTPRSGTITVRDKQVRINQAGG